MKKLIIGFCFGIFITACATKYDLIGLPDRILDIHDSGKLVFSYCEKYSFFGECKKYKNIFYDLSDKSDRLELKDFRCVNRLRYLN